MPKSPAPSLAWSGATPVSQTFSDPYYALSDGAGESAHVFLAGNGLPGRFAPGFHIAELGFGTGLNLALAWAAWAAADLPGPLRFTSFEKAPMRAADMARALGRWPDHAGRMAPLIAALADGARAFTAPDLDFTLIEGDARATLPAWSGRADAWFLDGFSPAKNPELWHADLLRAVAARTRPGGSFATYTAAGHVRRALAAAGFTVTRSPGYGGKRHMTSGRL
ncbi:MAG: tRNA (5-methylaminomethyl-2-thiouridine)(34)-methyltransferase MnmD [Pseudomonadota bacterium]